MANIKEFIYNKLNNTSFITDFVQDRIYPTISKENSEFPLIVYSNISWNFSNFAVWVERYQISIYGKDELELENLKRPTMHLFNNLNEWIVVRSSISWVRNSFDINTRIYRLDIDITFTIFDNN